MTPVLALCFNEYFKDNFQSEIKNKKKIGYISRRGGSQVVRRDILMVLASKVYIAWADINLFLLPPSRQAPGPPKILKKKKTQSPVNE